MVASLDGIIFHQFYGDNTGGAEFDTDGDGTPTQEDEFVSVQNTSGSSVDLSGWQIWSDMSGAGAPDGPQDGLYHTFPPGTVLAPGKTLHIVNEYTGTPPSNIQEASQGGLESGAGGINTNFLSEGAPAGQAESVALVNPTTGEYIILNLASGVSSGIPGLPGFPGTTSVGESNAADDSGVEDQNAGSSYTYNSATDSYDYQAVMVMCFAAGTLIGVPGGAQPVEDLAPGDLVTTLDHGPQAIRKVLKRRLDFLAGAEDRHKPIEIRPGVLGPGCPNRRLVVSPQHRVLIRTADGRQILAPAKGLTGIAGVHRMGGRKSVRYFHLVFDRHQIISAEGCWTESFFPGATVLSLTDARIRSELLDIYPELRLGLSPRTARPAVTVREARNLEALVAAS